MLKQITERSVTSYRPKNTEQFINYKLCRFGSKFKFDNRTLQWLGSRLEENKQKLRIILSITHIQNKLNCLIKIILMRFLLITDMELNIVLNWKLIKQSEATQLFFFLVGIGLKLHWILSHDWKLHNVFKELKMFHQQFLSLVSASSSCLLFFYKKCVRVYDWTNLITWPTVPPIRSQFTYSIHYLQAGSVHLISHLDLLPFGQSDHHYHFLATF